MSEYIEKITATDGEQTRTLYTLDTDAIVVAVNEMIDGKKAMAEVLTEVGYPSDVETTSLTSMTESVTDLANRVTELTGNVEELESEVASLKPDSLSGYAGLDMNETYVALAYADTIAQQYRGQKPTTMYQAFNDDTNLVICPTIDTSEVTDMSFCFNGCTNLTTIPLFDTSKVAEDGWKWTFRNCNSLTTIPKFDLSNTTTLRGTFHHCVSLSTLPNLDFSKIEVLFQTFFQCYALTEVPEFDYSSITDGSGIFQYCSGLKYLPHLNTANASYLQWLVYGCSKIERIESIDMKSVFYTHQMFMSCSKLTYILMYNVGALEPNPGVYDFSNAVAWGTGDEESRQSLIDSLLTYSYDRASEGLSSVNLWVSEATLALLTEEEIAAITAKGYSFVTEQPW